MFYFCFKLALILTYISITIFFKNVFSLNYIPFYSQFQNYRGGVFFICFNLFCYYNTTNPILGSVK